MPNKPRTQHRSVRIGDPDWVDLDTVAEMDDTDRAKVINAYVQYHLRRPGAELPKRPSVKQVAEAVARRKAKSE